MLTRMQASGYLGILLIAIGTYAVHAHGVGPWGRPLGWHTDQIDDVIAAGGSGKRATLDGRDCVAGGGLSFRVNDDYAFDIDETVWLNIEFYLASVSYEIQVSYHRNDAEGGTVLTSSKKLRIPAAKNTRWYTQVVPLENARFANLGFEGSDFSVGSSEGIGICSVSLKRSYTTPVVKSFGAAEIEVIDKNGTPTPARMAIYGLSGYMPLPSDEALALRNSLAGTTRVFNLEGVPGPFKSHAAFYVDGRYYTRLPVGEYNLLVAKGPEYRVSRRRFKVRANSTTSVRVAVARWTDMTSKGWYSGEDHIHYARSSAHDDRALLLFTQAEDLRVANILQFDNIANAYLPHYDWNTVASDRDSSFVLVSGQEAPRTTRLGHTALLNTKQPYRDPASYLLYHKAFEHAHGQGGLAGYAHATRVGGQPGVRGVRGMSVDVPFGLVDFAEIMMPGTIGPSIWFDFLNLGYKISPTAGTDYPFYSSAPGGVRNYVRIDGQFTPHAWFAALKAGRTFVTSGPMLEFRLNDHDIGSEVYVRSGDRLVIEASASVNPDIDTLSSLELIEQGDTVKTASAQAKESEIALRHAVTANRGTWYVVQARGKDPDVVAMSAPIFVFVDGKRFWKVSEMPSIVERMKLRMQEIFEQNERETTEAWEAQEPFNVAWSAQSAELKARVAQAGAIYDDLLKRAAAGDQTRP